MGAELGFHLNIVLISAGLGLGPGVLDEPPMPWKSSRGFPCIGRL